MQTTRFTKFVQLGSATGFHRVCGTSGVTTKEKFEKVRSINYKNHHKSLAYFSHLILLVFLLKGKVKRGRAGTMPPSPKQAPR